MTVLARLTHGYVSMQCDVCTPPNLTINTPQGLRANGWTVAADANGLDACANCSVRIPARQRQARGDAVAVDPDPDRLPNLVVIGAMKAGTTSVHNYLDVHPEISVSVDKEMRFFTDPDHRSWIGAYQDQFQTGTRYRAESTPFYTKAACFPGVVDRMADLIPEARLIYLVRDPIERLVAEYVEQLQWRATTRTLEEELADPEDRTNGLIDSSRYATQLEDYLRRFDRDRILVLDLADLASDVVGTMGRIFDFLELDRPEASAEDFVRFNVREDRRALPDWLLKIRRGPLGRAAQWMPAGPRGAISHLAWKRTGARLEVPMLDPGLRASLEAALKPEADRFRQLTGQSFATWSI